MKMLGAGVYRLVLPGEYDRVASKSVRHVQSDSVSCLPI